MKGRIVKKRIGVMDFYYPQVYTNVLFIFKAWCSIAHVFLDSGDVSWYQNLGPYSDAATTLRKYETLYGITLEVTGEYNWHER